MTTMVKEAARQILGEVSDIQVISSLSGMDEINIKLASIREKAAFLLEEKNPPGEIIQGYRNEVIDSLGMLGESLIQRGIPEGFNDEELLLMMRFSEIFLQRSRVYFERKQRYQEKSDG